MTTLPSHPTRWLILHNLNVPDSLTFAQAYAQARGIPDANLCGLALPTSQTIDAAQFAALNDALRDFLDAHGLTETIRGLLLGFAVPGYVDFASPLGVEPLGALLHVDDDSNAPLANPLAADALPTRPTDAALGAMRFSARIDAPDLPGALALIDRASAVMGGEPITGTLYIDPYPAPTPLTEPLSQRLRDWAASVDRQALRLPMNLSAEQSGFDEASFESLPGASFYWGWDEASPPPGLFASPGIMSLQLQPQGQSATTLRSVTPTHWIDAPLDAGYAAAAGASRSFSLSSLPIARPFFAALRAGWTLAEAWLLSLPVLREGLYLVGDPLMTVPLPRAGWDVFGPLDALTDFDADAPAYRLRHEERSLPLGQLPGGEGWYVVRHVDAHGRSDHALTAVALLRDGAHRVTPPLPPVWPSASGWPVLRSVGGLRARAVWDRPLGEANLAALSLQTLDAAGQVAAQTAVEIDPRAMHVDVPMDDPPPGEARRCRWVLTSPDGVTRQSPRCEPVTRREPAQPALQTMGVA